jgi:hypothetical protein
VAPGSDLHLGNLTELYLQAAALEATGGVTQGQQQGEQQEQQQRQQEHQEHQEQQEQQQQQALSSQQVGLCMVWPAGCVCCCSRVPSYDHHMLHRLCGCL